MLGAFSGRSSDSVFLLFMSWVDGHNVLSIQDQADWQETRQEPSSDFGARLPGWQVLPSPSGLASLLWPQHLGHIWGGSRRDAFSRTSARREKVLHVCPPCPTRPCGGGQQSLFGFIPVLRSPKSPVPAAHYRSLLHKPCHPHSHLHPHLPNPQF